MLKIIKNNKKFRKGQSLHTILNINFLYFPSSFLNIINLLYLNLFRLLLYPIKYYFKRNIKILINLKIEKSYYKLQKSFFYLLFL